MKANTRTAAAAMLFPKLRPEMQDVFLRMMWRCIPRSKRQLRDLRPAREFAPDNLLAMFTRKAGAK